jgi:hypothetical protein
MKPGRVLYLMAGFALLAVVLIVWRSGPREPVYRGKALTQWINEAHDVGVFEQTDETEAAMLAFGTNAIPFLLKEFTRPVSRFRGRLYGSVNRHRFFRIHLRTDEERILVAGRGLMLLETNAAPAMPVLTRYLGDPNRDGFVMEIFYSLGDAALPHLTPELASTNAVAVTNVLETLQWMAHETGSIPARDAFAAARKHHHSPFVRAAANETLRKRRLLNASVMNE